MIPPLADDEVQLVVPQAVLQNVLDGRTQMLQDQADDGGTAGAAAQSHLRDREWRRGITASQRRSEKLKNNRLELPPPSRRGPCCCQNEP